VRRIVGEQFDKMFAELDAAGDDLDAAVHSIRKRCKKVRALLRLVRPGFEKTYRKENAVVRDGARRLSSLRDAAVRLQTFDSLQSDLAGGSRDAGRKKWRERLDAERRREMENTPALRDCLDAFRRQMEALRGRLEFWRLDMPGRRCLLRGFRESYAQGRRAVRKVLHNPTDEAVHECRKRVKDHRYQVRLLDNVWPRVIKARRRELHAFSDILGNQHDLAVLFDHIRSQVSASGDSLDDFRRVVEERDDALRRNTRPLALRLYAEKPGALTKRMGKLWKVWKKEGNPAAGEGSVKSAP